MLRLASVAFGALLVAGCAQRADESPVASDVDPPRIVEGSSAMDGLQPAKRSEYESSEHALGELVVAPSAVSDEITLGALEIDDPNGNGRIDDRWYPPRVRESDCAVNVDLAPVPTVAVAFIPGDPTEPLDDSAFGGSMALLEAPYKVAITVQLFDEASQRDALAETMQEFWATWDEGLDCEGFGPGSGPAQLLGDLEAVDPVATEYPAVDIESGNGLMGRTTAGLYSVGDRVLLTVALTEGGPGSEDGAGPDSTLLERAVHAQIAQLEAAGLG
jgi:hypothetical protein